MQSFSGDHCREHLKLLTSKKPLVHCITNFVSMDLMANALCAIGASPAMVHGTEEVEEFSERASILYINVGTLSKDWLEAMKLAAKAYNRQGKPWVLDPVAAGGTNYRTKAIFDLLELKPSIVRGNASEITALANGSENTGGVDSTIASDSAIEAAKQLASAYDTIVAVSGETDYVTDGTSVLKVQHGCELMSLISAAGCTVTAIIAAFLALGKGNTSTDRMLAASFGLGVFGLAAEAAVAADESGREKGPGTLKPLLLDELYFLSQGRKTVPDLKISEQ